MVDEWEQARERLKEARAGAERMGGRAAIARAKDRGKLTARERVSLLLDDGSFEELGKLVVGTVERSDGTQEVPADNVVTGWGTIDGRVVLVAADDGTTVGGAGSILNVEKRFRLRTMAIEQGCPFIGLYEGSAIRFQDSMDAGVMARIPAFKEVIDCAGVVPQFAAILGPAFGRPPMDVLYADFSVQAAGTGHLALSGPALVEGGIGEQADIEALSGVGMTVDTTGVVDKAGADELACLRLIRAALGYFPSSCHSRAQGSPPLAPAIDPNDLSSIVPASLRTPYDMAQVVEAVVDRDSWFEYKPTFARSLLTGLARIEGRTVGVVANQPNHKGGVLDAQACFKMRRFVHLCNAFHFPLVFLEDQPGFMIGDQSERDRILYWAGGLLGAVQRAAVPKFTVILRKAHGAAVWTMGGQPAGSDLVVAWPIAIMTGTGPASAVNTIHARDLDSAADRGAMRRTLESQYNETGSSMRAAREFGIDDVIDPGETRMRIASWLTLVESRIEASVGRKELLFP